MEGAKKKLDSRTSTSVGCQTINLISESAKTATREVRGGTMLYIHRLRIVAGGLDRRGWRTLCVNKETGRGG